MANFDLNDSFVKGADDRAKINKSKPSDNLVMLNARVPKKLRDRVKLAAVTQDRSNASIIEEALEEWLKKSDKKNKSRSSDLEDDGL